MYQGGYFTMKKKIVCVLVMAMMTVSLAGCGGAKKAESTAASTAAAASTAVSAAARRLSLQQPARQQQPAQQYLQQQKQSAKQQAQQQEQSAKQQAQLQVQPDFFHRHRYSYFKKPGNRAEQRVFRFFLLLFIKRRRAHDGRNASAPRQHKPGTVTDVQQTQNEGLDRRPGM